VRDQQHHVGERARRAERGAVDVQVHGRLAGHGETELPGRPEQLLEGLEVTGSDRRRDDLARPLALGALRRGQGDRGGGRVVEADHAGHHLGLDAPQRGDRVEHPVQRRAGVAVLGQQGDQPRVVAQQAVPARRGGGARLEVVQQRDVVDQGAQQRAVGPQHLETLGQMQEPPQARDQGRFAVGVPDRADPAAEASGQVVGEAAPAAAGWGHQLDLEAGTPAQAGGHGWIGSV
jgi:hypothetical protein